MPTTNAQKPRAPVLSVHAEGLLKGSGSAVSLTAYLVRCVRFNYFVRLSPSDSCNTRQGWLARPCPTRTLTLSEAPSLLGAPTIWLSGAALPCPLVRFVGRNLSIFFHSRFQAATRGVKATISSTSQARQFRGHRMTICTKLWKRKISHKAQALTSNKALMEISTAIRK